MDKTAVGELEMSEQRKGKEKSVFQIAMTSLLAVLLVELLLFWGSLAMSGVLSTIDQNAKEILAKQVESRAGYLTGSMVQKWADPEGLTEMVNSRVSAMLASGEMKTEDFDRPDGSTALIGELCPELIDAMLSRQVTGIFVLFHTQPLSDQSTETVQGIYLRNQNPESAATTGILAKRAPKEVVQANHLAADADWQPVFSAEDSVEQPFFRMPLEAVEGEKEADALACGYWTTAPYRLSGDEREAIAYSQPLILPDGTVYGVVGVELLADYLRTFLPCGELLEGERGSYMLAYKGNGEENLKPVIFSGGVIAEGMSDTPVFSFTDQTMNAVSDADEKYFGAARDIALYGGNARSAADQWYLVGMARTKDLLAFSAQIRRTLTVCFLITMLIGLAGILLVSYRLSKPIRLLSDEVRTAQGQGELPCFSYTGVREIDQFSEAIARLQQEVMDSATRFTQIIRMSSVDLAGYELKEGSDKVFVTENYFPLMGAKDVDIANLTVDRFREIKLGIKKSLTSRTMEDGSTVYTMNQPDGSVRYLRSSTIQDGDRLVGLLEDVTAATLEKKQIERERDSDTLTRLYGRHGFVRESGELFAQPEMMKQAALVMLDLDNLKTINDRYGHAFGDLYLQKAAGCFQENTPENALCARIGGDEFVILLHGFDDKEEIMACLQRLEQAIRDVEFVLPGGHDMGLSVSAGYSWYPQDSDIPSMLLKYADFAMYQVKRTKKGRFLAFDKEAWEQQKHEDQSRIEFHQMLETRKISYHFQPIFQAQTGEVYGYEALMRVDMPNLRNPEVVLQIAREEGCMAEIERLTMFVASENYMELLEKGQVSKEAFLFINSIANEDMTLEEEREYHERFGKIQDRVVIEITETENMELSLIRKKSMAEGFTGTFALDDYGSGYNSELNLLNLNPRYVKVDVTIVRDLDTNENKQQIVKNIVAYAHQRDMLIIAEGIETGAELKKLLELEVDLLQGFYLARPGAVPPALSEDARLLLWDQNRT